MQKSKVCCVLTQEGASKKALADSQGQMRKSELRVLRKIYIPEIAIRLTRQLTKASRHSPR